MSRWIWVPGWLTAMALITQHQHARLGANWHPLCSHFTLANQKHVLFPNMFAYGMPHSLHPALTRQRKKKNVQGLSDHQQSKYTHMWRLKYIYKTELFFTNPSTLNCSLQNTIPIIWTPRFSTKTPFSK